MEKQKQQQQRDQAKKQQQQQKVNSEGESGNSGAASALAVSKPASSIVHLDPIQSIANVLNHHHLEQQQSKQNKQQQQQQNQWQQVSTEGKNFVSVLAAVTATTTNEGAADTTRQLDRGLVLDSSSKGEESVVELSRGPQKRAGAAGHRVVKSAVLGQVDQATGRPVLLKVDNKRSNGKKPAPPLLGKTKANLVELEGGVDITTSATTTTKNKSASELAGLEREPGGGNDNDQLAADSVAFKRQLASGGADLVAARELAREASSSSTTSTSKTATATTNITTTNKERQNSADYYKCAQVDQGNSYLYAYNDFITPSAHLSSSNQIHGSGGPASREQAAALKVSDEQKEKLDEEHDLRIARPNQQTNGHQIRSSAKRESSASELLRKSPLEQAQALGLLPGAPQLSLTKDKSEGNNNNITTRSPEELFAKSKGKGFRGTHIESNQLVVTSSGEGRKQNREEVDNNYEDDYEGEREEEEDSGEEDEGEETLSYILNQHIPLVAQQQQQQLIIAADSKQHSQECNLLHLNQFDASIGQLPAHLVCRHQLALVENPNHLRQYLQIEENFNNYKAARHKSTRRGGVGVAGPQAINSVPVPLSLPLPVTATIAASQQQQASVSVYQERAQLLGANDEQCQAEQIQANCNNKHLSSSSFLPLQSQQTSTTPATSANYHHHHHHNQQANLSSSSLSSSLSSLANLTTGNAGQLNQVSLHQDKSNSNHHHTTHRHHQPPPGGLLASPRSYLQFLTRFAPLSFGSASSQQQQQQQGNAHRKMYSASQQVGQLAGQAGAYYVTTSTVSNGDRQQQQDNGISQAHLSHTQIQQQHTMMNGNHPANQHHLDHHHHHHHHHSNNNNQHQQQLHMPQSARAHTQHHHQQLNHLHHNHNQQHSYPVTSVTSDSSLGSSGAFATSAVRRTTSWLRDFCSKRCLFVTCLMLIVFIFILVISLSAYLNFLISANKVNLQPLSGRLRVMLDTMRAPDEGGGGRDDSQLPAGQTATTTTAQSLRQLMMMMAPTNNSSSSQVKMATSQEFLQKQRDFETILRGALDRTQPMLKTYPNHLVKLEVYSFKPVQPQQQPQAANDLWVYFRLFVNKRSLQLDGQLMKRKSPDEQFDKQFLPRLTQQTLLNGFEQLITSFGPAAAAATANNADQPPSVTGGTGARVALVNGKPVVADQTTATDSSYTSAAQQLGINSRRFGHQQQAADSAPSWSNRRPSRAIAAASAPLQHRFASSQSPSTSSSSSSTNKSPLSANQQQQLKSFDEQISRLMHLIEAIDLQSIFVTPEFDMIQTMQQQQPSTSQIMSETLKASRPMIQTTTTTTTSTTTTSTSQPPTSRDNNGNNNNNNGNIVMVASGSGGDQYEYQDSNSNNNNNNNKLSSTTSLKEKQLTTRQPPPRPSELEVEEEDISNNNNEDEPPSSRKPERKFTLNQNYRENSTRPSLGGSSASTTSSTPTTSLPPRAQPKDSLFLLNHQQKPAPQKQPTRAQQQQSSQQANQAVVKLVSGQPVVSQSGQTISVGDKLATSTQATIIGGSGRQAMKSPPAANGPFAPLPKVDQQRQHNSSNQTPARNAAGVNNLAPVTTNRATFASTSTSTTTNRPIIINNNNSPTLSASTTTSTSPISIPELWQNTFSSGKQNGSSSTPTEISNNNVDSSEVPNGGGVNGARPRLITVTTIGSSNNNNSIASSQRQLAATASQSGADGRPHLSASEWEKISVLEIPPVSSNSLATMRAPQLNAPSSSASSSTTLTPPTSSSSTTQSSSSKPPKVAPHLNYAGSLVSTSGSNGGQGQQQKPQRQQQLGSAVVLNRDLSGGNNNSTSLTRSNGNNNNNEGQQQQSKPQQRLHSHKPLKQQRPGSNDASHTAATAGHSRSASLNQRTNSTRSSAQGQQPKPTKIKKVVSSGESGKNQTATGDGAGSSASSPKPPPSQTATTNGKGIRIVDNFLASIGSAEQQQQQQAAAANKTSASVAQSTRQKQQESSAQQQQALLPTLPTTIELTRSTTALPPSRTTPTLFEAPQAGSKPAPRLQQPSVDGGSSRGGSGGDAIESGFVIASQQARPGTTSFSGQWRPLASGSSSQAASSSGEPGGGLEAGVNLDERDFWSAANRTTSSNGNGIVSTQRPRGGPSMPKPTMANFSLIVATERLPATLNQATGSQSPFSMPGSVMSQPLQQQQPQVINRFGPSQTSGLGVTGAPPRTTPPTNDFESHRVSRMRQSQAHSHRATDHINPFGASSMSSTTTSSSMNLIDSLSSSSTPPNTRIVDDFMITTTSSSAGRNQDSLDSGGRATTLLPPLVLSGLQGSAPMVAAAHQRSRLQPDGGGTPSIALVVSQGPKRTRGPFAFETLRSFAPVSSSLAPPDASSATIETSSESIANPSEPVAPDSFEVSEPAATTSIRAERSSAERQSSENSLRQQQHDNYQQAKDQNLDNDDGVEPLPIVVEQEKLLLRKRLFVDSEPGMRMAGSRISGSDTISAAIGGATSTSRLDEDDLSILPSTSSPLASQFNNNNNDEEDLKYQPSGTARFGNRFSRLQAQQLANATRRSQQQHQHQLLHNNRCLYFGCLARGSGEFVCLNSSQICDDSIDCQDESDELDCVSLLKLEPKTDRMGFSNGAGIIYLNRRGSLAPMCLDYFGPTTAAKTEQQPQTNGGQALTNSARQLDELVKQINAIGQYACSLQSFSRLVSVKINHHDLVDGSNQIRSSRVFHRLTVTEIVAGSGADNENNQRQKDTVSSSSSPFSGQQSKSLDSLGPSNARYQVSISTSSECPSQRTVFVKCGGFECGQDSFGAPSSGEIPAGLGRDEPSSSVSSSSASLAKASLDSRRSTRDSLIMNDFPWLVKLYHFNSLACLGYLIDESWLIAASECFQATNSNTNDDLTQVKAAAASAAWSPGEWTAEISYEHYGNDDYRSIETNRRGVKDVIVPPPPSSASSITSSQASDGHTTTNGLFASGSGNLASHGSASPPIVLAKLERPVRFSPLNRPICLPASASQTKNRTNNNNNTNSDFIRTTATNYKDCLTASLPLAAANRHGSNLDSPTAANYLHGLQSPTQQQQHNHHHHLQDHQHYNNQKQQPGLVLNKVELTKAADCFQQDPKEQVRSEQVRNLICANELGEANQPSGRGGSSDDDTNGSSSSLPSSPPSKQEDAATRVLICSQQSITPNSQQLDSSSKLRSKWVVVGVQFKQGHEDDQLPAVRAGRQLFASVSSQIDWIVDTMDPKSVSSAGDGSNGNDDGRANPHRSMLFNNNYNNNNNNNDSSPADYTNTPFHLRLSSNSGAGEHTNELNPLFNNNNQQKTCSRFRCSSGECLSWSRICDGLYDCSSHDDEKDCHK